MKNLFTLILSILFVNNLFAQPRTSVANGNWTLPTTWDCNCVPLPGNDVIINHTVTLTLDWGYSSGSITINPSGTLTEDSSPRAFGLNGGSFINSGNVHISKMAFFSGNISNSGTLNSYDSLYLTIDLNNTGTITSSNFYTSASFTNNGTISGNNLYNNGNLLNNNNISYLNHYNNAYSTNNSQMNFNDYTNAGIFYNISSGYLVISNDCTNGDSLNHDAHWFNNGITTISNNFLNTDTLDAISTPNKFCVYNNSSNIGAVLGVLDFCDQNSGTFDYNAGTISNGVTICGGSISCFSNINKNNNDYEISVYPNPAHDKIAINFSSIKINNVQIVDILGNIIYSKNINNNSELIIDKNNIVHGIYFLKLNSDDKTIVKKIIFE